MMSSLLKIAVLLAVVAAISASPNLCSIAYEWKLDCSGKGLSFPPPGLWPNVTVLDLSSNAVTNLPKLCLSGFSNLRILNLSNNIFTTFKFKEFASTTNLTSLHIENNEIETFTPPPRGTNLQNLEAIFAYNNRISYLEPYFFSFAPNLRVLNIRNNPLIVEPAHPVLNHPELQSLRMSFGGTGLNVVDSSLLAGLPSLYSVDLSSASISSVEGAFINNKHLKYIYLDHNVIKRITPGTFATERNIWNLDLSKNPLDSLDPASLNNAFASFLWNSTVKISDTPLACGCGYEDLLSWAKSQDVHIKASCKGQSNCSFARPP